MPFLSFLRSNSTASRAVNDRLTPQQRETLAALRKLSKKTRPKRLELLKQYAEKLKADKQKAPQEKPVSDKTRIRPQFMISASMPLSVPKDIRNFLKSLISNRNARSLKFVYTGPSAGKIFYLTSREEKKQIGTFRYEAVKAPKTTATSFGIFFYLKEAGTEQDKLEMVIRYPTTPLTLRSPAQKNLGDLMYRLRLAQSKQRLKQLKHKQPSGRK